YGASSRARLSGTMLVMPSKMSACTRPATPSSRILAAVGVSSAREYCKSMPGYFRSKASFSGRTAWLTVKGVYQTTLPSLRAASISVASAAPAGLLAPTAVSASRAISAGRRMEPSFRGAGLRLGTGREIFAEPAAQQIPDARIALTEHEMIGVADEVQLAGLAGALEHLDRLLGGCHRVVGGVQQQQRPRRNTPHHLVGAEVEHALRGLGRKRLDGIGGEIVAQVRRDRHDVVARHHQRFAGFGAVLAALLEHAGEARPFLRSLVLAAELALAVAPAAVGDDRGDALVDAAGIDRDCAAEARADQADAGGIDRRMLGEEAERAPGVLDLLETDHAAEFALGLAAPAHVEAQHYVAELAEHLGRLHRVRRGLVAAEAVQHQEGGAAFSRQHPARDVHDAGNLQAGG